MLGRVEGGLGGSGVGGEQAEQGAKKPFPVAQDQAQVVARTTSVSISTAIVSLG